MKVKWVLLSILAPRFLIEPHIKTRDVIYESNQLIRKLMKHRSILFLFVSFFIFSINIIQAQNKEEVTFNIGYTKKANYYKKWQGRSFIYHNMVQYDDKTFPVPYPWQDGRIRYGKYKASPTALSNYINDFKKFNGKKFTFVKYLSSDGVLGVIFAAENGDSIFYTSLATISAEFLSEDFVSTAKKCIGKQLIVRNFTTRSYTANKFDEDEQLICQHRHEFLNTKTNEPQMLVPLYSKWTIKGIDIDYTYWGEKSIANTIANCFPRLQLIIENPRYGTMKIFANETGALCKSSFTGDYWYCPPIQYDFTDEYGEEIEYYGNRSDNPLIQRLEVYNSLKFPLMSDFPSPTGWGWGMAKQEKRFEALLNDWCLKGYDEALFTRFVIYRQYFDGKKLESILQDCCDVAINGFFPAIVLLYDHLPYKKTQIIQLLDKLFDKGFRGSDMGRIYINYSQINNSLSNQEKLNYERKARDCGWNY